MLRRTVSSQTATAEVCLVTGASGFIGRELVGALVARGEQVRVLSRSGTLGQVDHIRGSVLDDDQIERAMDGVNVVYHLAGYGSPSAGKGENSDMYLVNAVGTLSILEAAERAGVRRVVSASSAAVYGAIDSESLSEDMPVSPATVYGLTKLAQEQACGMYSRRTRLEAVSLRLFNVYGAGEKTGAQNRKLIPEVFRRIVQGEPVQVFGDGMQTRDFIHVHDVVSAFIAVASTDHLQHSVINVGTGVGTAILDVILRLAENVGKEVVWDRQPFRDGDVRNSVAKIDRALELGIRPTIAFETGVRDFAGLDVRQ